MNLQQIRQKTAYTATTKASLTSEIQRFIDIQAKNYPLAGTMTASCLNDFANMISIVHQRQILNSY